MRVKIIYETQTGTTQYVAEVMQKTLQKFGHQVELHSLRYQGSNPSIEGYDVLLFGAPTYEDGKIETGMRVFITKFSASLQPYKVAVFGLGNSTYPQFCIAANILEDWVKKQQGALVVPPLRIDGFPDNLSPIEHWLNELQNQL